jgi:uncharacterized membrane protein YfcA
MSKYITAGSITGVLSVLATIAGILHYSPLQAVLSDPNTAAAITTIIGVVGSAVSAFMVGNKAA